MLKLIGKEIFTILRSNIFLSKPVYAKWILELLCKGLLMPNLTMTTKCNALAIFSITGMLWNS